MLYILVGVYEGVSHTRLLLVMLPTLPASLSTLMALSRRQVMVQRASLGSMNSCMTGSLLGGRQQTHITALFIHMSAQHTYLSTIHSYMSASHTHTSKQHTHMSAQNSPVSITHSLVNNTLLHTSAPHTHL